MGPVGQGYNIPGAPRPPRLRLLRCQPLCTVRPQLLHSGEMQAVLWFAVEAQRCVKVALPFKANAGILLRLDPAYCSSMFWLQPSGEMHAGCCSFGTALSMASDLDHGIDHVGKRSLAIMQWGGRLENAAVDAGRERRAHRHGLSCLPAVPLQVAPPSPRSSGSWRISCNSAYRN